MTPTGPAVDLDPDSRQALEFDDLLAWLASFARTVPGRRRIAARVPSADTDEIRCQLAQAAETRRYLQTSGRLLSERVDDPSAALEVLAVPGWVLEAKPLRELASSGLAIAALKGRLGALDAADYPWLSARGAALPELERSCRRIAEAIEPEGRIRDEASPGLRQIRGLAARRAAALEKTLLKLVRDPGAGATIRDEFITRRAGRFVVPVRVDAPRPLRGIVHASSSSGATQFVEPLETVEANNELVRLAEREREEEQRLLAEWSECFRRQRTDWSEAFAGLADVDDAQARALFAEQCDAVVPEIVPGGALRLVAARHPLLDRRLRIAGARSVPIDLGLDPAAQVLVVSGPNAGGKTVALKTLGLVVLMAQAGIPVPAREVRLPCFRQVRVDIGDHQSIQADLSTFSAHVSAIARFLAGAEPPALLLLDEIGSGTEPGEGGALARAVLESLVGSGITVVATTHLGDVKEWAAASGSAVSAAMEFDAERLRPTFRILMGASGVSAGLAIARRVGLSAAIVERAREHLGPDAQRRERYLLRLQELVESRERERETLAAERNEVLAARRELEQRLTGERQRWRRQAAERVDRALEKLMEEGRRELSRIGDEADRRRRTRRFSRAASALGIAAKHVAAPGTGDPVPGGPELPAETVRGRRVHVVSLGRVGEVVEERGSRVRVRMGEMLLDADRADLRLAGEPPSAADARSPPAEARGVEPPARIGRELLLIGRTAEQAGTALDKFLDAAMLSGHDEVRIVHGHGTGRLRSAVRELLARHPGVASHRPGRPEEGGDGATIATLAETPQPSRSPPKRSSQ